MHHTLFYLKKLISNLLLPLSIAMLLLIIGLICLLCQRRRSKAGIFCCGLGVVILLVFSLPYVPRTLLHHLEQSYHPVTQLSADVHTVVVLGGGVNGQQTDFPPNTLTGAASLSRLVEGIRLYRLLTEKADANFKKHHTNNNSASNATHSSGRGNSHNTSNTSNNNKPLNLTHSITLILSGGQVFGAPAVAGFMRNAALFLGVPNTAIKLENGSQDTAQEARLLKHKLGQAPFYLVTSAYHMQRALWLFQSAGLHPIAAPTQYLTLQNPIQPGRTWIPSSTNLSYSDIAIHEYIGLWWAKLHKVAILPKSAPHSKKY